MWKVLKYPRVDTLPMRLRQVKPTVGGMVARILSKQAACCRPANNLMRFTNKPIYKLATTNHTLEQLQPGISVGLLTEARQTLSSIV